MSAERVLSLHRREPTTRDEVVPVATIYIDGDLPQGFAGEAYEQDAEVLANLLWDMLPGGTIDQLLMQLMERRAALLRVGFLSVREIAQLVGSRCGADCSEAHTYDDGCLLADPHGARPDRKRPGHVHGDDCPAGCDGSDVVG